MMLCFLHSWRSWVPPCILLNLKPQSPVVRFINETSSLRSVLFRVSHFGRRPSFTPASPARSWISPTPKRSRGLPARELPSRPLGPRLTWVFAPRRPWSGCSGWGGVESSFMHFQFYGQNAAHQRSLSVRGRWMYRKLPRQGCTSSDLQYVMCPSWSIPAGASLKSSRRFTKSQTF